jgi:hypothetical protein
MVRDGNEACVDSISQSSNFSRAFNLSGHSHALYLWTEEDRKQTEGQQAFHEKLETTFTASTSTLQLGVTVSNAPRRDGPFAPTRRER